MSWVLREHPTPRGEFVLIDGPEGLAALDFAHAGARRRRLMATRFGDVELESGPCVDSVGRLDRYLAGELRAFEGVRLQLGGTAFQRRVWAALLEIPAGETRGYGELAAQLGLKPGASRAVGLANGANPVSIAVPCHRVVGADGSLTGYAGGLPLKRWLLAHEGVPLRGDRVLTATEAAQADLFGR